jgi:hypothetical protein
LDEPDEHLNSLSAVIKVEIGNRKVQLAIIREASTLGCPAKNIKFDFHEGLVRLRSLKLILNCRKKNQPDKISPSFPLFT